MELRREPRYSISTSGRYRRGTGIRFDISIKDLSEYGCQFYDVVGRLEAGDEITLRIGTIGPLHAKVRWIERRCAGVEFDQPLYPAVLDHIIAQGGKDEFRTLS
ncbi:PilZ domain-containing protein [Qipengyuania sp. NPDC077563]|uniref:PilZ domain-containing protein n=1 Tax=Qipengyuania sp. NPDC077563 TaxID=3364497 RepID=UPI00384BEDBA